MAGGGVTTIEYVRNPREPSDSERWQGAHVLLGAYRVRFEDGFTVMIPHDGWLNTISEDPLDMDDDEHRAAILRAADRLRMEHHTKADLDVLLTTDEGTA